MAFHHPPPRGLRVLHLRDRLVLHDISFALRADPSDRNALVDAANAIHHRHRPSPRVEALLDLDLPTPPAHTPHPPARPPAHSYLVLPFAPAHDPLRPPAPFHADTPERAGLLAPADPAALPVDAAAALLGLLPLHSAVFAVLATHVRRAAAHPAGPVLAVAKVRLVPLRDAWLSKHDKEVASALAKLLESGALYFSLHADLAAAAQPRPVPDRLHTFCWNLPLAHRLPPDARRWTVRAVYGFVATHVMRFPCDAVPSGTAEFHITVISRRSRLRAGTRYITRGADALGNVANFVETEQIVWRDEQAPAFASFLIVRGSVPVFWRQNNGIAKPSPELDEGLVASRRAFARHFDALKDAYGHVSAVSLVDKHGSESVLADAFERHLELYLKPFEREKPPKLVAFDFHSHCSGKEYERGLSLLLDRITEDISNWGFFATGLPGMPNGAAQQGVFRVNCVDCLDRTNVVQSMIARVALSMQLAAVFAPELGGSVANSTPRLYSESEDRFKHLWGDNADAISKQYSGTGALKTDFTRTGKRSTTGVIGDGVKSVMRMYYKNFVDEARQEVIDLLCGNVLIRQPAAPIREESGLGDSGKTFGAPPSLEDNSAQGSPRTESLWYSFEALRINAGGDKQPVVLELHDETMYVISTDGISIEYPRNRLISWSKRDDGKPSDKKVTPAKLRLSYKPVHSSPATASPLDLQFRGGTTARENFLRALISWARPETADLLSKKDVRVRIMAALNAGAHNMADWGLAPDPDAKDVNEIVALVLPEGNALTRSWGLAAVPIDVDFSDYVLIGACAVTERGPAIAVLASKPIAATVMMEAETTTRRASSFGGGGAAAIALQACGTSFCFVSAKATGLADVHSALASLRLGRQTFDVTNQFHHFSIAGLLGDVRWCQSSSPHRGRDGRSWVNQPDGSACYTLDNGLSIMRNCFPTLRYDDRLSSTSLWNVDGRSSRNGESMSCMTLSDGIVDGRPGPQLPKELAKCIVTVSDLRADELLMPKGIEQASQMSSIVVLYCDFAKVDGVASRQTSRPSSYPEWREPLTLTMMPSDLEEIYEGFIIGQIVIPTPLADPIPAGHFVLPIAYAKVNKGGFEIPCRIAGRQTARLHGTIQVADGDWDIQEGLHNLSVNGSNGNKPKSMTSDRNSLPPIPKFGGQDAIPAAGSDFLQRRPQSAALSSTEGVSSLRKKGAMEEMNGKLNAARRKGSKQMKSVVNRLSSLLNQPSSSSGTSRVSRTSSFSSFSTNDQGLAAVNSEYGNDEAGGSDNLSGNVRKKEANMETTDKDVPGRSRLSQNSQATVSSKQSSKQNVQDDLDAFGLFQAASDIRSAAPTSKTSRMPATDDLLLKGLREGGSSHTEQRRIQSQPPVHVSEQGLDSLMSGLANQKKEINALSRNEEAVEEDDWGDFEGAAGAIKKSPAQATSAITSSTKDRSLIDF